MDLGNIKSITLSLNKIILRKVKDKIERFKSNGITLSIWNRINWFFLYLSKFGNFEVNLINWNNRVKTSKQSEWNQFSLRTFKIFIFSFILLIRAALLLFYLLYNLLATSFALYIF